MSNSLNKVKKNMQATEDARTPMGLLKGQATQEAGGNAPKISPQLEREIDVYRTAIMKILHSKETQPSIMKMLESGPPEQSIPATAIQVNNQVKASMKPKDDVVLGGSTVLVTDLLEMADAAGMVEGGANEGFITQVYQDTLQKYIEMGIDDGSIDPVQLQQDVEPLMTDEQRAAGTAMAQERGLPMEPTQDMATDRLVSQGISKEKEKYQSQQGMLKNMAGNAVPGNKGMGGI